MKQVFGFFCICTLLFMISSCKKRDVHVINGKLVKCDFASSTGPDHSLFTRSGGISKTYFPNGSPKTLTAVVYKGGLSLKIDSLYYSFTYTGNTAHVTLKAVPYDLGQNEDYTYTYYPAGAPRNEEFNVVIDPKTGFATSAKGQTFTYKNGRLDLPYLKYDSRGNIIENTVQIRTVYEYDYTKTAKQQFYFSAAKDEIYTLLEILGWIPVAPTHLLKKVTYTGIPTPGTETYVYAELNISQHKLNKDGFLTSFTVDQIPVQNTWNCFPVTVK